MNVCFCFFEIVPKGEDLEVVWILSKSERRGLRIDAGDRSVAMLEDNS